MIERIILIIEARFTLRDYNRFGIEVLQKNGFKVEVWELSPILRQEYFKKYTPPDAFSYDGFFLFKDKRDAYDKLANLSSRDFIISIVGYSVNTLWVYRALNKSSAKYAVFYVDSVPVPVSNENRLLILARKIAGIRYLETWKRLFMKLPLRLLGTKPASLILTDGDNRFNYNSYSANKNAEILHIHALDYDLYLREKDKPYVEKPIVVYIDIFLPLHPDYMITNEEVPIAVDKYYALLNKLFEFVEKKTGFEIVIAAHPRSYYEKLPDYFNGRKCIKGNTVGLIKECRFVISQASTAVNFANLFYKPVIFITASDFENTWEIHNTREMAKCFGKKPVFMERPEEINFEEEMKVNKDNYDAYRENYIKKSGSEELPFWQVVANRLKKGF